MGLERVVLRLGYGKKKLSLVRVTARLVVSSRDSFMSILRLMLELGIVLWLGQGLC